MKLAMLFMSICAYGYGKECHEYGSTIGIGMSAGAVRRQAELSIGHAFSPHWSVSGRVSIALSHFFKKFDNEEKEHYEEFDMLPEYKDNESAQGSAAVTYWITESYKGIYFRLGGRFSIRSKTDIEACIGYFFKIWKGLYADFGYEVDLISSYHNERISGNGISIGIHFKF